MPLSAIRVVELANILAGPLVGQFCAELGADVIKVEQPGGGDPTRGWYLAGEDTASDVSAYFSCANWGKRSVTANLGDPEGQRFVHDLVRRSDVVIMGYKPGDDARYRADYATLRDLNPGLIYLQITAYGADDPRPGFDAIIQAESGFTALNGEAGGEPVKMPVALVDLLAAHQLKEGLLLALLRRQGSGAGSYVSTSLLGSAAASLANQASNYLHAGVVPVRMGSEHPNIVPYGNIFPTRDGRDFVIAVGTEPQFRAFVAAVGRPELAQDARFVSNTERVRHRLQLNELLGGILSGWDSDDLDQRLRAARVPFGFLNDIDQVFAQPAARAQLLAGGRGVRTIAFTDAPGRLAGRAGLTPPPHLDQHGAEVRAWLAAAG